MAYATNTIVTVEKTKSEIEKLLAKNGATGFITGWHEERETLVFTLEGRQIRFMFARLSVEDLDPKRIESVRRQKKVATLQAQEIALEQANRTRWRELLLGIKAKLVLVDAGITTTESEFLAQIVLANNQTFGDWAAPFLKQAYLSGQIPPMLPPGRGDDDE